ncbi:MAG: hypothetical protein HYV29_08060 [Ignavibacteriales bacterium]|nr:hypothetical protein [Ignavibacteriales bacterium]
MANLTEVKTVFTIDLSPYLSGLKSVLTMTQQTGAQLKPLLNLEIDKANFTELEKTYDQYLEQLKASIPAADEAGDAATKLGGARDDESDKTTKSTKAQGEHEVSLKKSKREALEAYGAVMFLTQGILRMASSATGGNKELEKVNRAMSEGVGQGFELAGLMGTLGIASGGTAVAIGAVATVAITLTRVFTEMEDVTGRNEKIQNDFARTLIGMTIPQMEEYRKKISEAIVEGEKQIALEKERSKQVVETGNAYVNLGLKILSFLGITWATKETEESLQRVKKEGATIDEQISGKRKTQAEIEQFILQAKIDSLIQANDRQRAEAKKTWDDEIIMITSSEAAGIKKDEALISSKLKYEAKIREITIQEQNTALAAAKQITDAYLKAADDRFESELNLRRASLIMQGAETETIELRMIQARRARFEAQLKELSSIVGPVGPETLQKQTELEKQITQLEAQEAEKRKSIKQNEKDSTTDLADLQLQEVLSRIRLRGIQTGKTEEQIQQETLNRKKQALESELGLINESEQSGTTLDQKTILRKQQVETELSNLAVEGAELRKQVAEDERQNILNGLQSMASNIESTFGSLFQLEQQRTTRTLNEEKKRQEATLETEKNKKISAIEAEKQILRSTKMTAQQREAAETNLSKRREAIEQEYADKKSALDASMEAKAREQMKTMFGLQKASQIANAMINTYSAAVAALAPPPLGLGPVFGPIVAATAIAAGLANIAVISAQEVPGLEKGGRLRKGDVGFIEGYGSEIVAPEKTFVDVFKTDLAPRITDILIPQIRADVLAAISVPAGGGQVTYIAQIHIENFSANNDDFEKLKQTVEDAMRRAGTDDASTLFRNQKRT